VNLRHAQEDVDRQHAELYQARDRVNKQLGEYNELVRGFEEVNEKQCERLRGELMREVRGMVEQEKSDAQGL
jgi:hypothetical protein